MANIEELKRYFDLDRLHDLAAGLGLERPQKSGNYKSPNHDDKNPSLSLFDKGAGPAWKDFSADIGGDAIALVCYVLNMEVPDAMKWLHDWLGIPLDKPEKSGEPVKKSLAEYIADDCIKHADQAISWLCDERKIAEDVVKGAIKRKTLGFNVYTNPKKSEGEFGYGGDGVGFIVREPDNRQVVAVDMRYINPELNGNTKTQTQGEKDGFFWCSDWAWFKKARTVVLVESSINALSVESCRLAGYAALSIRGTGNAGNVPVHMLQGKQVIICMDNDEPNDKGVCPGAKAAWELYERCCAANVAAQLVDWSRWPEGRNDINDILQHEGPEELARLLKQLEPWVIPGLQGNYDDRKGKARVYLPFGDSSKYWTYRCSSDFTQVVTKFGDPDEEDESTEKKIKEIQDLCSFRVAQISRVTVASATSTMSGEPDAQPRKVYSVSVQTPLDGPRLVRKVLDDEAIHNVEQWKKFGPVFSPAHFNRLLTILYRSAHLGERTAINLVGLGYRDGKLSVNEGQDCFFTDEKQQCPYYNLTFTRGRQRDAKPVVLAYQSTMGNNAAASVLNWALGGHLKVILGFWPHMQIQADKGSGKSTLIKRLERSIGMVMKSGQSMKTEYRLVTSVSATTHPVGWEELSQQSQMIIDRAQALLQETYQYTVTNRGTDQTEFLLCAPVLLAGEDVPVEKIAGKIVRASFKVKGPLMSDALPRFPVYEWLQYLANHRKEDILRLYADCQAFCKKHSRAPKDDNGANRMVDNYAALLASWRLLAEFADIPYKNGNFVHDLLAEMNLHIKETTNEREPWIWIMDLLLSEVAAGKFRSPYQIDRDAENKLFIAFMPRDVMHHLATSNGLKPQYDALSVKTPRVFKGQLMKADVVMSGEHSATINGRRQTHMVQLDADKLAEFGLYVSEDVGREMDAG